MGGWIGSWAEWRRELAAAALIGAFFGVLGPFGTFLNGPLELRLPYWTLMSVAGLVFYGVGLRIALEWGRRLRQPVWFVLPLAVFLLAIPASVATAFIVVSIWPQVGPHVHPGDWYGEAVLLALPLSIVAVWSRGAFPARPWVSTPAATDADGAANEGDFLGRLPPRLGRNLLCLQMEDHYVRAHTDRGSDLVMMPLKAAIAELGGADGLQVHRSWWVARAAVLEPVHRGRSLTLRLSNGIDAPVARSAVARLRESHWLDSGFSTSVKPPHRS